MSSTLMSTMIMIVLTLHSVTDAFRMLDYRRPVCTPEQSCSYEAFGIIFALCDCPGKNSICPHDEKNAVEHRGTFYNFCSSRNVPICEDGEISTTVAGIQTAIHCICPEDSELVQQPNEVKDVTDYVCRQKRHCIIGEVCGLRSSVGEKRLCECPTPTTCAYPKNTAVLSSQVGKCLVM